MTRKIIREYSWWTTGTDKDIEPEHEEKLEHIAEEYINNQIYQGFREGTMSATVQGKEYQGYWKNEEKTVS